MMRYADLISMHTKIIYYFLSSSLLCSRHYCIVHQVEEVRTNSEKPTEAIESNARTGPTKGLEGVGDFNKNRKRERQIWLKILKGKAHAMSDKNVYYCVSVLCSIYYRDECLPRAFASHGYIIYHMAHNFESSADQ